jgi:hypothetical protein
MTRQPEDAVEVLRAVWSAEGTTGADLDAAVGGHHGKACKNAKHMSFEGFADGEEDVRTAWRTRLEREGKLAGGGQSIRDLVLGPDAQR